MFRRMQATVIVSVALLVGACSSTKPQAESPSQTPTPVVVGSTVITGKLLAVGGPAPGTPRPLPGKVTLVDTATHVRHDVRVATDGKYSVTVPPGTYEVQGHSPRYGSGTYMCNAPNPVTVAADRSGITNVYCQEM